MGLQKLYDHVPIWVQHVMVTAKGYANHKARYGKAYFAQRRFLEQFDTWPYEKQVDYQQAELVKFLHYAAQNSPFYKALYKGIDLSGITKIDDLKKLPIVDKEMLRKHSDQILAIPRKGAVAWHTGGTTGKSLVVWNSREDNMERMAMLDHFKAKVGFEHLEMKRATFNGKHIVPPQQKKKVFWRYNAACKQMIFSSFHLSEENIPHYIKELNRFKPQAIDGFFTCICDVANYLERHDMKLVFQPVAVFPTSETLTESGRALVERVFQCKVYDQYASSEGAPFITECAYQVKHMEISSGVFEYFEEGTGEVLVTSFTTHGTPLIRYRIGDAMAFDESRTACPCGSKKPRVKMIEGRQLDFLYTADGAKVNAGNVANLFKNMPNALIRAQLIQERMGEVTALLEVDKSLYAAKYDDLLREEFAHKFGRDSKLTIQHVDAIPREKSGKYKMIKNNVTLKG